MNDFVLFFNNALANIKTMIESLYSIIKIQYLRQIAKSFASYMELKNVLKKRNDNSDDFQDLDRIYDTTDLILDRDGLTLKYRMEEKYFKDSLYTQDNYPMIMNGSHTIPGSKFKEIFNDGIGFWGYQSDTYTDSYFSMDFQTQELINKIYLETNNVLDVTLYVKEDYNSEYAEIGTRGGRQHVWNMTPRKCVSVKFLANTDIFSVARIQAGLATYQKTGIFESIYYKIDDLYRLKIDVDGDIPGNTNMDLFIDVSGQLEPYKILNDTVISGGVELVTQYGDPLVSGILPSGYIADSLMVKVGYDEWDIIQTNDLAWTILPEDEITSSGIISFDSNNTELQNIYNQLNTDYSTWQAQFNILINNLITISDDYVLMDGSLQKVFLGSTTFTKDTDYSVTYDLTNNKILLKKLENSSIPEAEFLNLSFTILARKKEPINQVRTYVNLAFEQDIILQGFIIPFRLRHVVIKDEIIRDVTQAITIDNSNDLLENINGVTSYVIDGQPGTNLVEIECYDTLTGLTYIPDPMTIDISNVDHFAKRYNLVENSLTPNQYEYRLDSTVNASGVIQFYQIIPGISGNIWAHYAVSTGIDSYIKLRAIFSTIDGLNTPTLRSYALTNYTK